MKWCWSRALRCCATVQNINPTRKPMMKKLITSLSMLTAALLLGGCQLLMMPSDVYFQPDGGAPEATYDVPPKVVYRLDAQRYVTLENYKSCSKGDLYYNDTAKCIHSKVSNRGASYLGRIINADPSGNNLVIP